VVKTQERWASLIGHPVAIKAYNNTCNDYVLIYNLKKIINMRKTFGLLLIIPIIGITSCNKSDDKDSNNIYYASVNKQYVFTRDVKTIAGNTDEVSLHLDSILTGKINAQVVSTGSKSFDLNNDKLPDLSFEIIDLNLFNINKLPASFDSLAVRVAPTTLQILDNSTYQYADALSTNYSVSSSGNWTSLTCVIGTFGGAGQFKGKGEKYLGIRLAKDNSYLYGWIKLYCSQKNDTLRIIEYAYNQQLNSEIITGQKE
jgi:hypothetical protein